MLKYCTSYKTRFFQHVEEKIENTTVAKLECFIVMKIELITNKVNRWTKRAT